MSTPLDTIFAALADPTRRAILAMLLEDDMAVTDVAEPFAMSLAAISKHLAALTQAGLISQDKRGRVKWCRLEPDGMRAASVWMQGFGLMDGPDLDGFERFLQAEGLADDMASELAGSAEDGARQPAASDRAGHKAQDGQNDDDEADEIDDAAHDNGPIG